MVREGLVKVLLGNINIYYDFDVLGTWTRFMLQQIKCVFDTNFVIPHFITWSLKICIYRILETFYIYIYFIYIYIYIFTSSITDPSIFTSIEALLLDRSNETS